MSACHLCTAVVVLLCFLPVMFTVIGSRHWDGVMGPARRRVFRHRTLTFLLFLIFPVLLAMSLAVALPVALGLMSFWLLGFRIEGMQYAMNLTIFRVFGNEPASECTIYAMVRTESGVDELRGMRTDLKDALQGNSVEPASLRASEAQTILTSVPASDTPNSYEPQTLSLKAEKGRLKPNTYKTPIPETETFREGQNAEAGGCLAEAAEGSQGAK